MAGLSGVKLLRVRVNSEGVKAILNSRELDTNLRERAERVMSQLPTDKGEEWRIVKLVGDRISYMVQAANYEARLRAATDPVLQQALGAGRDA